MNTRVVLVAFLLATTTIPAGAQQIDEGDWVGRVIHLTGRHMDVVYGVRWFGDSLEIHMQVEEYGSFPFEDIRITEDSLSFTWSPSFQLECSMYLLDDGVYQGACMDPWGGFGGIVMAPPGSDVNAIELHDETIESIAGWTDPPVEQELPSLGDNYPLGRKVIVNERSFNVVDVGQGPVAVVLEAAMGDNLTTWEHVQQLLAISTRVFSYDRAGLGYSEPGSDGRSPEAIARELRNLLRAAGIPPPYVLVGHAEGSFSVRRFASLYEEEVAGLVLIDPAHEQQAAHWQSVAPDSWNTYWSKKKAFYAIMPQPIKAEFSALDAILTQGEIAGLDELAGVPSTVLTPGEPSEKPTWFGETEEGRQAWAQWHKAWVDDAPAAMHHVVAESGSYIHHEFAEFVVDIILQRVRAAR